MPEEVGDWKDQIDKIAERSIKRSRKILEDLEETDESVAEDTGNSENTQKTERRLNNG